MGEQTMSRGELHSHARGMGMASERSRKRLVERLRQKGVSNERVLEAMSTVQRHRFVDEAMASRAYDDTALPIGHAQTISQPFVVAHMTQLLIGSDTPQRVLEVGTGSGYQAAVLAELVPLVYTVERIAALYERARRQLQELGYRNVRLRRSDGSIGLPEYGPFDGIIVTAGGDEVPEPLLKQLADGGRLVAPVGPRGDQHIYKITRRGNRYERQKLDAVTFVPLIVGES